MSDLTTLPGMTAQAAERLAIYRIRTCDELRNEIQHHPGVISYIAEVSLERVTQWLAELERLEAQP